MSERLPDSASGWPKLSGCERNAALLGLIVAGTILAVSIEYVVGGAVYTQQHHGYLDYLVQIKQLGSAALIYCSDYDDRPPLASHSGTYSVAGSNPDSNSIYALEPYTKTVTVAYLLPRDKFRPADLSERDVPVSSASVPPEFRAAQEKFNISLKARFGFNSQFMHPQGWDGSSVTNLPVNLAQIASPEATVMLVSSTWSQDGHGRSVGGGRSEVDAPCIYDSKFRDMRPQMGRFSAYYGVKGWRAEDRRSPYVFGGAWPTHRQNFAIFKSDNTAKVVPLQKLVAGCNVATGHGGTVYDPKEYIWDLE